MPEKGKKQHTPEVIVEFIRYFRTAVQAGQTAEILSSYEESFTKLTDRYYKSSPWPDPQAVPHAFSSDPSDVFTVLYRELRHRHMHSNCNNHLTPTTRIESWKTYLALFDALSQKDKAEELGLPEQWLWDIVDEFLYQHQEFCLHRAKGKNRKAEEEATALANEGQDVTQLTWSPSAVLSCLEKLSGASPQAPNEPQTPPATSGVVTVTSSLVPQQQQQQDTETEVTDVIRHFAIVGLIRLHCVLGDFSSSLSALSRLPLSDSKAAYLRVPGCVGSLHYYAGISALLSRRYQDAARLFSAAVLHATRREQAHGRAYQADLAAKLHDQTAAALALCLSLRPLGLDESVHRSLLERSQERLALLLRAEDTTPFEQIFGFACPKFLSPNTAPPKPVAEGERQPNRHAEAVKRHLSLFLDEVNQQLTLAKIRSYLRLYTSIPVQKLASFLDTDVDTVRAQLLLFQHKADSMTALPSICPHLAPVASTDLSFTIDGDMIHVTDTKRQKEYQSSFLNLIKQLSTAEAALATPAH